jgi:hypothetical protein
MGVNPRLLRRSPLDNGYTEIHVTGEHAVAIDALPPIHKDLFDRLLIAQATVEGITLLTVARFCRAIPVPLERSNDSPYSYRKPYRVETRRAKRRNNSIKSFRRYCAATHPHV